MYHCAVNAWCVTLYLTVLLQCNKRCVISSVVLAHGCISTAVGPVLQVIYNKNFVLHSQNKT